MPVIAPPVRNVPKGYDAVAAIRAALTSHQRAFVDDPHRYKLARCTRRSGKTHMVAAYLIITCLLFPRSPTLYAGLTRDSAKEAVWDILLDMLEAHGIPHELQPSHLRINFPNDSFIQLFGCDQANARNRLRGRKFRLACFDETAFYAALDPLVYAILPALADLAGTLCLTSSPGDLLTGLFYEADQGTLRADWRQFFWTIHDNPFFQIPSSHPDHVGKTRAEEEIATVLKFQFQGNARHASFRREWLGEWVRDASSLVYPVTEINLVDGPRKLPRQEHAIGIAFGPVSNSVVIARHSQHTRKVHFIDAKEIDGDLDTLAKVLKSAIRVYRPTALIAHLGPYTKDILSDLRRRYHIPVVGIPDHDRQFHQAVFATDLAAGHIKINSRCPLPAKCAKIAKDPTTGAEIPNQDSWLACAALAVYRRIYVTHLASFTKPPTEEERHIAQIERSQFDDPEPWYERTA